MLDIARNIYQMLLDYHRGILLFQIIYFNINTLNIREPTT